MRRKSSEQSEAKSWDRVLGKICELFYKARSLFQTISRCFSNDFEISDFTNIRSTLLLGGLFEAEVNTEVVTKVDTKGGTKVSN